MWPVAVRVMGEPEPAGSRLEPTAVCVCVWGGDGAERRWSNQRLRPAQKDLCSISHEPTASLMSSQGHLIPPQEPPG